MTVEMVEILLVEDNPGDVLLTKKALDRCRLINRMSVASDGEEALMFLRREGAHAEAPRPDLILLDINLPKLDGREVLSAIKGDPSLRRIPVVMLTSSEAERDVFDAYDLHASSYIVKPPDLPQLIAAMQELEHYWFALVRRPTEDG